MKLSARLELDETAPPIVRLLRLLGIGPVHPARLIKHFERTHVFRVGADHDSQQIADAMHVHVRDVRTRIVVRIVAPHSSSSGQSLARGCTRRPAPAVLCELVGEDDAMLPHVVEGSSCRIEHEQRDLSELGISYLGDCRRQLHATAIQIAHLAADGGLLLRSSGYRRTGCF